MLFSSPVNRRLATRRSVTSAANAVALSVPQTTQARKVPCMSPFPAVFILSIATFSCTGTVPEVVYIEYNDANFYFPCANQDFKYRHYLSLCIYLQLRFYRFYIYNFGVKLQFTEM